MEFKTKTEVADRIHFLTNESLALLDEKDGNGNPKIDAKGIEKVRENEKELGQLQAKLTEIQELEVAADNARKLRDAVNTGERKGVFAGSPTGLAAQDVNPARVERKTIGQRFVESNAFTSYDASRKSGPEVEFEMKTLFDESTGFVPETTRIARIEEYPTRPIAVIDVIPQGTTDQIAVVYMEETTFTNSAAEVAEAAAYAESAFAFTERTSNVKKITNSLPITDEMRQDAAQIETYVTNRLLFQIRQRLDSQLISGNGSGANLTGLLNTGSVQTQAVGSDVEADAIHKAITKVRSVGFAEPTAVILHPNNWQKIHLMKTASGEYLYGAPWEPGPGTLWGLPVVSTTAISAGTGLLGAFRPYCQFFTKKNLSMMMGYNNDDFSKGKITIRADMRGAFVVFRPLAFASVTGLGS